mmetsp:Transcript_10122/g.19408  ORF Transcript_10122/g.19408 Transcript_10122/m.19408 type:complete len:249 (-) Transcript_10122:196-942(-)
MPTVIVGNAERFLRGIAAALLGFGLVGYHTSPDHLRSLSTVTPSGSDLDRTMLSMEKMRLAEKLTKTEPAVDMLRAFSRKQPNASYVSVFNPEGLPLNRERSPPRRQTKLEDLRGKRCQLQIPESLSTIISQNPKVEYRYKTNHTAPGPPNGIRNPQQKNPVSRPKPRVVSWKGVVYWYDPIKGYGFVTPNPEHRFDRDLLLLERHIRRDKGKVVDGDPVEFTLEEKGGQLMAVNVMKLSTPYVRKPY